MSLQNALSKNNTNSQNARKTISALKLVPVHRINPDIDLLAKKLKFNLIIPKIMTE